MLEEYKDKYVVAYNIMMNEITKNHISHAYLIDEFNNSDSFDFVLAFVKKILSIGLTDSEKIALFKRIDDGNYPEIKIIEPDGMLIKKQQILDLQNDFSMEAIEGSKRIYIIKDADKMRSETANSMLKFLEEPDNDIVAILMTNNFNNMLTTIISRCQIIRLNNYNEISVNNELLELALNFIKNIENSGIITVSREQELLFGKIGLKERDKMIELFDIILDFYYDILKVSYGNENLKYSIYSDEFKELAKNNSNDNLIKKIELILKYKDAIRYNVNVNLLIDSFIVSFGGLK